MPDSSIRIATRSSPLALWQAEYIKSLIETTSPEVTVEIVHIKTIGDRNQTDALRQFGGTGVFTKEVQVSVLDNNTDIAVHSLKDLPTEESEGLSLAGIPDRAPVFDAVLLPDSGKIESLDDIPQGARIGTGSPRRQAQLLHARPDLQMLEIRGNVDTRIRKMDEGEYDAIVLAEAGLQRLGLADRISLLLCSPTVFPAVGQGAIGVECRADDHRVKAVLGKITNPSVLAATTAERSLLRALRAGCHAPLGCLSQLDNDVLTLTGVLLSLDGKSRLLETASGPMDDATAIGEHVAAALIAAGGEAMLHSEAT